MPREKHHQQKKHHKDATNENESKHERPESRLFTKVDAEAAEISGYTANHGYYPDDSLTQERMMPTGVVEIDESVKLPNLSPKSNRRHSDLKAHNSPRSNKNNHTEYVHLPPISHRQHYPYGYYDSSLHHSQSGHLSYPYPVYNEHHSHHHHHHRHHRHHHHHRHHIHTKEIETYDPRWWYMPVNSVHQPKPRPPPEYHYVAPKWYESSNSQSKILFISRESRPISHKYVDCRCEVCRPSKITPRGTRWIVNE